MIAAGGSNMSAQLKGLLITAAIAYVAILLYHRDFLPGAKGAKEIKAN
jgi:hypothetical protein